MEFKSWDPLKNSENISSEILAASQKREIKNILKSYVGMYDVFSELIQNAMDAVDKLGDLEPSHQGKIWITIDLAQNSFSITDNGVGFNEEEFKSFLAPNISFKNEEKTRGNKGVGATYIGYGFNHLKLGTKTDRFQFTGEMKNGRDWVEDSSGIITRPVVIPSPIDNECFNNLSRGSTFTINFTGSHSRPKDISWYKASTPHQWLYLLLLKTPLGALKYQSNDNNTSKNIIFDLKIINKNNEVETLRDITAEFKFPHIEISASTNLKEILNLQSKATQQQEAFNIPLKYKHSNAIYEFFSKSDLLHLIQKEKNASYAENINNYAIEAYGYFVYSTQVWDAFNDKKAQLRKSYRVLRGGLQLANNRMIQGELIQIPLTSNIGYQNQCFIIVHFRNADPDLGRKGFQPELKEVAEKISVLIVNKFKKWRSILKDDTGATPSIAKEIALHEWITEQATHAKNNPLTLSNKNFFEPINEISITSEPQSEQDVIVLFNQLIAGGVIRGINLLATSQSKQYDSVYKFYVKEPIHNHIYNKETNPLGVDEYRHSTHLESPPKILEYKYNMDALIEEFESSYKSANEINLVVTWEIGTNWRKDYHVISLLDLDNIHQREFHGITHKFVSGPYYFYVIALKELIEYLNNTETVQEFQKSEYGLNI